MIKINKFKQMEKNNIINVKRLFLIFKRDLFVNLKTIIVIFGVVFGLFLMGYLLTFTKNAIFPSEITLSINELANKFNSGFFIIGIIISGIAFGDFRSKLKTQNYLLIPASTSEKFVSVWGTTTILYIISYFVVFVVFNLLLMLIGVIFSTHVEFLNVFAQADLLKTIGKYLLIQSIFLAGAASFTKVPILKTPLIAFAISIIFMILLGLITFLIFHTLHFQFAPNFNAAQNINTKLLKVTGKVLLYITPFVFWAITFFKLKEKQI